MKFLALLATILFTQVTFAKFIPITLSDAWAKAEIVTKIQVLDVFPQYWEGPRGTSPCGFTITANVLSQFKGQLPKKVSFASEFDMTHGKILLAFVNDYPGTFPSDVVWGPDFDAKKQACVDNLPTLKINPLTSSTYTYDESYLLPAYLLKFPNSIDVNEIQVDTVTLNGKSTPIDNVPFAARVEINSTVRYIDAKKVELWFSTK